MFKDKKTLDTQFSKGEKVLAAVDLDRVPAGTTGKVKLVNGFEWIRYWVFFDNGEKIGSIDGSKLVRPRHYDAWKARRQADIEAAEKAAEVGAAPAEVADSGDGEAASPASVSGIQVPEHLLERSKAARTRLGA